MTVGIKRYSHNKKRDREVYSRLGEGVSQKSIAKEFGLSKQRISQIAMRKSKGIEYRIFKNDTALHSGR